MPGGRALVRGFQLGPGFVGVECPGEGLFGCDGGITQPR